MTRRDDKSLPEQVSSIDHDVADEPHVNNESYVGNKETRDFANYVDSFFQVDTQLVNKASVDGTLQPSTDEDLIRATTSQVSKEVTNHQRMNSDINSNTAPINVRPINVTKTVTSIKLNSSSKGDTTMQDNVLNAFNDQTKAMYAPMSKFNSLLVESMEKMTEFQLNTIKSYAEIGLGQMKNAANIQDAEGMRQFTAAQAEATSIVNKKILEDAKIMSDMAADFRNKIEDVMAQTRQTAEKATVVAAKKAN